MDPRERLRLWIEKAKLTQRDAARLFGLHYTTLNQILTGRRSPALAYAVSIERHTGISAASWVPTDVGDESETTGSRSRKRRVA